MKPLLIAFSLCSLTMVSFSCRHTNSGTLEYERLAYDTERITIFKWDTLKNVFPNNSDPLTLTQEDLIVVDSLLQDAVDSFNTRISPRIFEAFDSKVPLDSFIIKQGNYKYQY